MNIDAETARKVLVGGRLGLAAGWFAPGALMRAFGVDTTTSPAAPYLARLFCAREAFMAGKALTLEGKDLDRVLAWGMAVDAADVVAVLAAGMKGQLPKRTVILAASSASIAVGLGYLARR